LPLKIFMAKILWPRHGAISGNVIDFPTTKKKNAGGSKRYPEQAKYNQKDCSRKTCNGTDQDRYPGKSDIGFSHILHEMKIIYDKQCDEADNCVYNQMQDVLNDKECDRQKNDNNQNKNSNTKNGHIPFNSALII
jgi:hypothetical protein